MARKVDQREKDYEEAMILLAGNLQKRRKARCIAPEKLGKLIGSCARTYCNKENDPGTFTVDQLFRVMQTIGFTRHEILETVDLILGGD